MKNMLIINKYIGLSDVENKCNDENILKQVDSIKMFSKLTALENSEAFLEEQVNILKQMLIDKYNISFCPAFVINGFEY